MPTPHALLGEVLTELVENIQQVFWMTDPEKFQMVYISPAYEKIWGRSCESLYRDPHTFVDAIHPDDRDRIIQAFGKQMTGSFDEEYRIIQPNGEIRWIRDKAFTVRNREGEIYRICGLAADITSQKELEKALEDQKGKMLNTSKLTALGEMAGSIAHEINTPLATIITLSSQLEELTSETNIDRTLVREIVKNIIVTSERIAKIVKGLRSHSRDGSKDQFVNYSVSNLIDETLAFCTERFKFHGVDIRLAPIPQDLQIYCRPTEISQVLLNLLNNAFDAVQTKEVKDKWIEIATSDSVDALSIAITDSGTGIPTDVREKLFQPFFTTKAFGHGTGLGLSISRRIVRDHSGELELDPQCRHTRFFLKFSKKLKVTKTA